MGRLTLGLLVSTLSLPAAGAHAQTIHARQATTLGVLADGAAPTVYRVDMTNGDEGCWGTAFAVRTYRHSGTFFVTNKHVVDCVHVPRARVPRVPQLVAPWSGRRLRVKAVVMSPTEDLAVIETAPLPRWQVRPLVFATTPADAGDTVLEEGYGSTGKAAPHAPGWTSGSVDAIDDALVNSGPDAGGWTVRDAVLHEATTYPGDSGGPLLNLQGQVVGVNDAGNDEGEVATPARTVRGEAAALILDILDAAG